LRVEACPVLASPHEWYFETDTVDHTYPGGTSHCPKSTWVRVEG